MRSAILPSRRLRLSALALLAALTATANAADPLVWKFEPGAKYRYRMTQHMQQGMDLGAGGKEGQDITNIIEMSWVVDKVNDDGSAAVTQKLDRMTMTIKPPQGDPVEFDSSSTEEATGFAAMIAPLFREMTRATFTLTMSPRGKISDVSVPDSLVETIAAAPGAAAMGDLATAEGLEKTMERMAFELPETLDPSKPWTSTAEAANPVLGKQTIKITYRYVGPRDVDGVTLEVFKPTLDIAFAGGAATAKIEDQTTNGEILFNRTAGRLESTSLVHHMTLVLTTGGQTITQTLDQETEMKWLAEGEE
jgi:hypothetical protein